MQRRHGRLMSFHVESETERMHCVDGKVCVWPKSLCQSPKKNTIIYVPPNVANEIYSWQKIQNQNRINMKISNNDCSFWRMFALSYWFLFAAFSSRSGKPLLKGRNTDPVRYLWSPYTSHYAQVHPSGGIWRAIVHALYSMTSILGGGEARVKARVSRVLHFSSSHDFLYFLFSLLCWNI